MKVADICSREVVTAGPKDSVREALLALEDLEVRHLPLVDAEGCLIGIISDRDLRDYRLPVLEEIENPAKADQLLATPLEQVMKANVISISGSESLKTAVDLMIRFGIGALPVLEQGSDKLAGIISYVDLLRVARPSL